MTDTGKKLPVSFVLDTDFRITGEETGYEFICDR